MSKIVSTRLDAKDIEDLNEIAKIESLDRASLMRKFLIEEIKQYRMRKAGEYYRKGVLSLQEAATAAKVSLWEMMDFVEREKIQPPEETDEEIRADFARAQSTFKKS